MQDNLFTIPKSRKKMTGFRWHRCRRCGKRIWAPESVARGKGPVCYERVTERIERQLRLPSRRFEQ